MRQGITAFAALLLASCNAMPVHEAQPPRAARANPETFATQLLSWVAIENDIVAASRDPGGATKLALTQDDRGRLVRSAVVAPSGVTLVLFILALLRLRRS